MDQISTHLKTAIARAVEFLAASQLPYGEFANHRFTDSRLKADQRLDSSPFATCFVLYALWFVGDSEVTPMINKGLDFLLEEREEPGVWRYWSSRNTIRIDPDLDDSCCASFVLKLFLPEHSIVSNEQIIQANRAESGLFKTWLRAPDCGNDTDTVVNANVLLYLGEREETTAASHHLNRVINDNSEVHSYSYYLDPLALYYMVSRAYFHRVLALSESKAAVIQKTLARQAPDGSFGDEMLTGLALCTLLNYGAGDEAVEKAITYLIQTQQPAGSWPRSPFYAGPEPPIPHNVWWGSEELTTAFCLEGLARSLLG